MDRLLFGVELSGKERITAILLGLGSALLLIAHQAFDYSTFGLKAQSMPGSAGLVVFLAVSLGVPFVLSMVFALTAKRVGRWGLGFLLLGLGLAGVTSTALFSPQVGESGLIGSLLALSVQLLLPFIAIVWAAVATDLYDPRNGERVLSVAVVVHIVVWGGLRLGLLGLDLPGGQTATALGGIFLAVVCLLVLRSVHGAAPEPPGQTKPQVLRFLTSKFAWLMIVVIFLIGVSSSFGTSGFTSRFAPSHSGGESFLPWVTSIYNWISWCTIGVIVLTFPRLVARYGTIGVTILGVAVMVLGAAIGLAPAGGVAEVGVIFAEVGAALALKAFGLLWLVTSRSAKFSGRVYVFVILVYADAAYTIARIGYIPSAWHAGLALLTALLLLVTLLAGRKHLRVSG